MNSNIVALNQQLLISEPREGMLLLVLPMFCEQRPWMSSSFSSFRHPLQSYSSLR